MKKLSLLLIVLFYFCSNFLIAQTEANKQVYGDLIVNISGLKNSKGDIKIGLFNSKESYQGKTKKFKGAIIKITDKKARWVVKNIPFGTYAIKAFHDEDGDDQIDTNVFGIPTESYGFSNNAKGLFGPPSFSKAKFIFNSGKMKIEVNLTKLF